MSEAEALARGCLVALLDTFSFQSPEFYRKQDYGTVVVINGYPDGVTKLLLEKPLIQCNRERSE